MIGRMDKFYSIDVMGKSCMYTKISHPQANILEFSVQWKRRVNVKKFPAHYNAYRFTFIYPWYDY